MASGQPPFFFHILMNPSSPHLPLPAKFVKKHLRNKILKKPILKSANGGYLWKLKMKKFDDHSFCFVDGWCKVVKDVGLLFGEFLLFKYVGSSVFLMHVYSVNGCEKILVPRINNFKVVDDEVSVFDDDEVVFDNDDVEDEVEEDDDEDVEYDVEGDDEDVAEEDEEEDNDDDEVELGDDDDDEDDGEDEDDVDVDGDDGDPFFVITSSKRNKNKLRFPPDLVAMAKIKTKETITLKNDDGYEKELPVRSYKQNKSTRYYVAEGWEEFQRSNNVSEGDECVLKFITSEDKLCLAKVTKKKPRATEIDNDDMDDDDGMDEEGEAEDAKEDDSNVDGDDIFDDDDIFDAEGKGENAKLVNDDEDDEEDDRDVDGDDGNPSFILTSSDKNQYSLRFSADFVALAGINTKETIILKNLDGYEKELRVRSYSGRSHRPNGWKNYYLAAGWKEFLRNSNISEGDKFVFKFITSEDKFCVAKITKNITRARPLPPAVKPVIEVDDGMDDPDVDDNDDMDDDDGMDEEGEAEDAKEDDSNVDGDDIFDDDVDDEGKGENAKFVNDDEDDENEDDDRDVDGDDGDPSFILTSSDKNQYMLYFPADFVALAGINTKETITLKNLDGYEKELHVRSYSGKSHRRNQWTNYYLAAGWKEFQRNSNISEGDKFVFKFITSEDKFCVAKITKKKARARPLPPAAEAPVTEEADDGMDDKDVNDNDVTDVDEDVELFDDGNPSFVATITPTYNHVLRMPADFARLSRLDTKTNLTFIASEDKLCLAKIIKKKTQARPQLQVAEAQETEFNGDDAEDDDGMDDEDVEDAIDKDENVEPVDDLDPFFVATIKNHRFKLGLPTDFVALAGIESKENIIMKGLDGNETLMSIRTDKRYSSTCYHLSVGWPAFKRSNNISEGDICVFKYITSEDKLCLAKITKAPPKEVDDNDVGVDNGMDDKDVNKDAELVDDEDPFFRVTITPSHKSMLRLPSDFVELAGIDGKKNIIIKCLDRKETEMALRPVKQGHSTWYCLSMGWPAFKQSNNISEGDECVFKYITSEDKMSLAKITKKITPPTEVDDNDLKVDDGMDGKNVVVDDTKDGDENVEPVDDGMDGKDVVVDDNKHEDENVELVDDGMDVDADDNKDKDKDVEFVVTITPSHKSKLRLPPDFVGLAGIDGKKNIIIKCPDGNERQMVLTSVKQGHLTRYCLSIGWRAFKRSNNISEGDECVFKYITSEDKMCLALTTKKEARARLLPPAAETPPTEVDDNTDGDEYVELDDDGINDKDVNGDDIKDEDGNVELADNGMDVDADDNNNEDEKVERVNDGMDDKDVDEYVKLVDGMDDKNMEFDNTNDEDGNENVELVDDGMDDKDVDEYAKLIDGMDDKDENEDAEVVDDEDPIFRVTITPSHKSMLRLPPDFVGLAGINTKENIIVKSLDGNETQMVLRSCPRKSKQLTRYCLSIGWRAFKLSNNISEGDECVFKYITSEDKMCLAEVLKRKRGRLPPAAEIKMTAAENVKMRSRRPPPVEITVAEAVKRKRGQPPPSSPRVAKDVKRKKGRAAV